jgi:hypothetical protein
MPEYLPGRFLPWEREEKEEGGRGKKKEKRGGREKRRYFGRYGTTPPLSSLFKLKIVSQNNRHR